MSNGSSSYQHFDGPTGSTYQDIDTGAPRRKFLSKPVLAIGALAAVGLALYYSMSTHHGDAQRSVDKQISTNSNVKLKSDGKLRLFDELDRYVLEDYDAKSTFSSFLPGVAGYFGKPTWAFYINRGQCMATFGTESKDYPILEFNSANKAYQLTTFTGFRTFIRGTRAPGTKGGAKGMLGTSFNIEPFSPRGARSLSDTKADADKPKRILYVGTNELELSEIDGHHGINTNIQYFIMPEEDFASLVRRTTFTNTGDTDLTLDVLDGLAKIEPFGGMLDGMLKNMGRTLEGWMGVYHADDGLTMPFYKLSTEPSDSASVKVEKAGHYCLAFIESCKEKAKLLPVVYDSTKVFGKDTSLQSPAALDASSVGEILKKQQYGWAMTSSAFPALNQITLKPGENITIASIYGKAETVEHLPVIADLVTKPGYIAKKATRARQLINELTAGVETKTVYPLFDGTVKQNFLDNSLRGGIPTILGKVDGVANYDEDPGVKVYHAFSRIHGDMERDYNAFKIDATYFSQGPGNYRDVAQNRRNDVTFFPRMASFDVQQFLSFIQSDGYEPLTVEGIVFRFPSDKDAELIAEKVTKDAKSAKMLGDIFKGGPFRPGQIFDLTEQLHINLTESMTNAEIINTILASAEDLNMAQFGTGYWGDHWDYYMDLIDAYLAIFPDGEEALMYDKRLRYFFSTATVKPRSQKYVLELTFDGKSHHVLQLDATYFDDEKVKEQEAFRDQNTGLISIEANWQRTTKGRAYMSAPLTKLFLLGAVKYATRDAWGMGIEYEGGRPGWLDSMNGLPGMVGSGMPETYELKLLLQYVKRVVDKYNRDIVIPTELYTMIKTVNKALRFLVEKSGFEEPEDPTLAVPDTLFEYWDLVAAARESYRNDVQYYFSGNETILSAKEVSHMVGDWLEQIDLGIARAFKFATEGYGDDGTSGIPASFFAYDVTDWELNNERNAKGQPCVNAKAMKLKKFPLFLEGPVRYMKTIQDNPKQMKDMYERILTSGLRDEKLKMYYLSASLQGQSYDMGRQMAFAPGWLENQSIWMHMSYKYYLQLLRGKLYDELFSEMKGGGMLPFMDADRYGRSLMECSSFIASSAFPDPSIVGQGFLARLSGSTAEFLDIWKLMFIGPKPFTMNKSGDVEMQLTPALPSWLFEDNDPDSSDPTFDEDGSHVVSYKLFASIIVTYHNPGGKTLYGTHPKLYRVTYTNGDTDRIDGKTIPTKTAIAIRQISTVKSIDAYF
ncbi:hypothetical protein MPSEU_000372400 [Mayamaea pseudoterrestris]|nr:hypothetical protein MPSEU_000372400 [Mayamaea pseudoterrestris]